MLNYVAEDPTFIKRLSTDGETCVHEHDVENVQYSSEWQRSEIKVMFIIFLDCRGVFHHKFVPQSQTVNKEYYLAVLRRLREVETYSKCMKNWIKRWLACIGIFNQI